MANNTIPISVRKHRINWCTTNVNTANTTTDLTSGTIYDCFTANSIDDSWVSVIKFRARGTNVQTVARIWINNGLTTATAANNVLLDEVMLPATTGIANNALMEISRNLNMGLPTNYKIFVTLGTSVAAGFHVSVQGGDY